MTTTYPSLRGLLGQLGVDWRAEQQDPVEYLAHHAGDDTAAVSAELAELCATAGSEYDYVRVIVESGARFSPYGDFGTAETFLRRLGDRLARGSAGDGQAAAGVTAAEHTESRDAAPRCAGLARLLVMLYGKGLTSYSQVLDQVAHGLGRLVDLGDVEPNTLAAELTELLESQASESDFARLTNASGARLTPDAGCPTTGDLLSGLRDRLVDAGAGSPELAASPHVVIEGTLAALKRGELHAGMTGLARMYGVDDLRIPSFPAFEARVGELLDQVLPQWVAGYVDDLTLAAETVADEAGWMRARWMRSAVELLRTTYGGRAAALFVDDDQLAVVDGLLRAPTARFGPRVGRSAPRFANSHWWWQWDPPAGAGASRAGLPMHPRWSPWPGVWRVKVPAPAVGGLAEPQLASRLSELMTRASLSAFGDQLRPEGATVMVQVLDAEGAVTWADASMRAEVSGGRLAVTDPDLGLAPPGEQVVTSATVRGAFGRGGHRAEWSVEVLRGRGDDGRDQTLCGSAVFALAARADPGEPGTGGIGGGDASALATALSAWEAGLGAPVADWRSSTRPTLVSRYGWGCDVFAAGAPRSRPLLCGVSQHLWAGELRLGLVGVCRAYGAGLLGGADRRAWRADWVTALAHAGREAVETFLAELTDETRVLDYPRWHLLCASRSGIQLVGEGLDDERLAGLFPVEAIRALDDAMRSFGRRFGPVPWAHVPGAGSDEGHLWTGHPWWRYPANATDYGRQVDLDELAEALWAELDVPESRRTTKATTRSLANVVDAVRAVCEGAAAGFSQRVARDVCAQVTDKWDLGATLTNDVLGYFQPIVRTTDWPLPVGVHPTEHA